MRTLFILSIASGYGGAERSMEIVLRHLPPDVAVHIYAESDLHIERLLRPGAMPPHARLVRLPATGTLWGRRLAALRLCLDVRIHRPQALLVNTHRSALVAAMAAKVIKNLGQLCSLYVRDFLWRDLDYIFERLAGARVIAPSRVVAQRIGYLNPFFIEPLGRASFEVIPDMVEMPAGDVRYDGPMLHLATINPWKGHADLVLALGELKRQTMPRCVRVCRDSSRLWIWAIAMSCSLTCPTRTPCSGPAGRWSCRRFPTPAGPRLLAA